MIYMYVRTYPWVLDDIDERDDVRATSKVLKDLDLTLDFLFLHRLQGGSDAQIRTEKRV